MNVIYFSPHFPHNYISFIEELSKKPAVNVIGMADADYDQLPENLKNSLNDYYKVNNMEDYDEVMRGVAYLTHKHGKIDHLDSLNEYWLFTEAKLRTDFNIPGLKNDVIEDMKFKSKMKQRFINAGIEVARGKVIEDLKTAIEFIQEVGYPVVAKPDSGVGAMDTYKISNETHLKNFFQNKPSIPYIFEEFVIGNIESFDGLTDKYGNLVFYTGHVYSSGVMDVVNKDLNVFYYSFREVPSDLEQAGRKILSEFNLIGRFFHFEFFRKPNGKLVALEVNMRPPGGYTTDMFNFGSDINVYEQWANVVTMNTFKEDYQRKYHVAYVGRKWKFDYKHTQEEIIDFCGDNLVYHREVSGVFSPALGNYGYLVRNPEMEEVKKCIQYIQDVK